MKSWGEGERHWSLYILFPHSPQLRYSDPWVSIVIFSLSHPCPQHTWCVCVCVTKITQQIYVRTSVQPATLSGMDGFTVWRDQRKEDTILVLGGLGPRRERSQRASESLCGGMGRGGWARASSGCCAQCLEQSDGRHGRVVGAAHCSPHSVAAALHWRGLGFPALPLLAPGSSSSAGRYNSLSGCCYIISLQQVFL